MGRKGLTENHIAFVEALLRDRASLIDAYKAAFPTTKTNRDATIKARAYRLLQRHYVRDYYDTFKAALRAEALRLAKWTQEQAIENALFLLEAGRAEIEEGQREYELMKTEIYAQDEITPKDRGYLARARKLSISSVQAMNMGMERLNEITGLKESGIQVQGDIIFTGANEIPD